jgi:riboflavin kinase/FMN adenylyltransferase
MLFGHVIALKFDAYLSQLSPINFLNFIHRSLHPQKIVVGYDFRYGSEKQGDADQLVCWGKANGVDIDVKSPFMEAGRSIKSSWIRSCIQTGDIKLANHLLGRPYCLIGRVESGEKRGRIIGYPTANINLSPSKLLPKEGVYSGDVVVLGVRYRAAISIGHKPTFNVNSMSVEVHIIGFLGDLYGHILNVELKSFIRDQYTFKSLNELQHQIQQDVSYINSL